MKVDRQKLAAGILVALLVVGAYINTFGVPFIFDDHEAIVANRHVHQLWPPRYLFSAPTQGALAGRPLVSLTVAFNYAISGLQPWSYHVFNLVVHLGSALVLLGIVRRTLKTCAVANAEGIALAIAAVWAVHPLLTESVTYIIQRTELQMAFFYLLTIYCVIRGWHVGAVVACAFGTISKEIIVSAPLIALLYDRVFLAGSFQEAWRQRRRLYLALGATWLISLAWVIVAPRSHVVGFSEPTLSLWDCVRTQLGVIVWYLKLALWPCPLVVDYFDWPVARSLGAVWLPALIVGMLLALTGWAAWRKPKLGFLGAWFFLILAPTTILPMATEVAAERRMYLPSIAVVTLVVLAMNKALERWPRIRVGLAAAVVLLFCGLTLCRNHDYGSEMRIWADAATKRPRNTRALINWGTVLAKQGRTDEAMTRYRAALAVDPQYVPAYFNLGVTFAGQGSNAAAIAQFRRALTLSSNSVLVLHNLGLVLAQTGETGEATNYLAKAVSLAPDDAQLHNDFGALLARHGNLEEALQQFRMAAWLSPDDASARQNLRRALFQLGRTNDTARLRPTPPH